MISLGAMIIAENTESIELLPPVIALLRRVVTVTCNRRRRAGCGIFTHQWFLCIGSISKSHASLSLLYSLNLLMLREHLVESLDCQRVESVREVLPVQASVTIGRGSQDDHAIQYNRQY
jgi:hypothetical protein